MFAKIHWTRMLFCLAFVTCSGWNGTEFARLAAQEKPDPAVARDQKKIEALIRRLESRGVEPTLAGVRQFLQLTVSGDQDPDKARALIEQLNSPVYSERLAAQQQLLLIPNPPFELLKKTVSEGTQEQAFRARVVLNEAEPRRVELIAAVLEYIQLRAYAGLASEVFSVAVKENDNRLIVKNARLAMATTAEAADFEQLVDEVRNREASGLQAVAMSGVCAVASSEHADSLNELAADSRVAEDNQILAMMALADLGDRRCLDLLFEKMSAGESGRTRSESCLVLRKLTGQNFGFAGFAKPEIRKAKAEEWSRWLAENRSSFEMQIPLASVRLSDSYLNGNTLLAVGYRQKVIEIDPAGNEVWSYECQGPWSAEKLANGNYLIAEYNSNRVIEVNPDKEVVQEFAVKGPLNARPTPEGTILVSSYTDQTVIEFDSEGEEIWKYKGTSMVSDAVRTSDGLTLVAEYQRATLVNREGEVVWEIGQADIGQLDQIMGVQPLENGNFLICSMNNLVVEVDREKNEVWRYEAQRPSDAFRTFDGTTLVTEANRMFEIDMDGQEIWTWKGENNYGAIRR